MRLRSKLGGARTLLGEARQLQVAVRPEEHDEVASTIVVSGMLAEQLARELGRGALPGAVRVRDAGQLTAGDLAVHVFAGQPSGEDADYVRHADRLGVPVVLVQLWPQDEWTAPFVLTPFVVECRPGQGFPVDEIARRIVDAVGAGSGLGDRIPVLRDELERRSIRQAVGRAAVIGMLGGRGGTAARPLITLEQARLVGRLDPVDDEAVPGGPQAVQAGTLAALQAWGFGFRELARRARRVVPTRVTDAAVAAGGTWVLATLAKQVRERAPGRDERSP